MNRAWILAACAAAAIVSVACGGRALLSDLGLPVDRGQADIVEVVAHGAYLVATLENQNARFRFLFPTTPECTRVVQAPGLVEYWREGRIGEVVRGVTKCKAVGIGSLEAWRDRNPRPLKFSADENARYTPIFVDDEVLMLRGSFPQTSYIGWSPNDDTVVIVPRNPGCEEVANEGQGALRFHASGFPAFTLSGARSHCAVIALADPA
jgi:hypothetical protein